MTKHIGNKLSSTGKLFLTAIGCIVLTVPLLIGALTAPSGLAQTQENSKPSFDVISIKPAESCIEVTGEASGRFRVIALSPRFQPGRFSGCSSLKGLIAMAYQVDADDIAEGPGWIESANYTIEAKAEGETDTEVLRLMLQSLLQERFGLEFHTETREKEVYALRVAEGGHKLKQAVDENGEPITSLRAESMLKEIEELMRKGVAPPPSLKEEAEELMKNGAVTPPGSIRVTTKMDPNGGGMIQEFYTKAISMERFAGSLQNMVGRKVVDRTGLTGFYDITLETAPARMVGFGGRMPILPPGVTPPPTGAQPPSGAQSPSAGETPAPLTTPSGPSVFSALKDQLGLKLESDEAPLEHIVIDSAEKPSEN